MEVQSAPRLGPAPLFPAGWVSELRSGDIDELMAAAGWEQQYLQLGSGHFSGRLVHGYTAQMQIGGIGWNAGLLARGATPPGCVVLGFTRREEMPSRLNGVGLTGTVMANLGSSEQFDFHSEGSQELAIASIHRDVVDRNALTLLGMPWTELKLARMVQIASPAMRRRMIGEIDGLLAHARAHPSHLGDPLHARRLEDGLVTAMILSMELPLPPVHPAYRHHLARRAEEFLHENRDRPVTIHELCAAVGAAERTLHLGFREYFGLPPMAYLKMLRLNEAHRALRLPEPNASVTGIAMRCGFTHLGEFAAAYRRLYQVSPSQTLRDAIQRRHGPTRLAS
jgi:AraC family ethanolamine operon transcriptional activator